MHPPSDPDLPTPCHSRGESTPLVRIRMECPDLRLIPNYPLPSPFTLRLFQPGDVQNWVRIESAADQYQTVTAAMFEQQFGADMARLIERQLYLCNGTGEAIGTATAWLDNTQPEQNWGRIHWVAILPAWQGQGLAKPLLSAACTRLRELGHLRAYLMTETVRLAAIALYRKFGFIQTG
jgi:GNAT superfamily N-acetyltransferase